MAEVDRHAFFVQILQVVLFLVLAWVCGRAMKVIGVAPLLGELIAGILLGPGVANIAPYSTFDGDLPSVLILTGHIGVMITIMKAGLHISFADVWKVGWQSFAVAIFGTVATLGVCLAVNALAEGSMFDGLTTGAVLAPTSVAIGYSMLADNKKVESEYGKIIVAASFLDDLLAIVLLVVLMNVSSVTTIAATDVVWPLGATAGFVGFAAVLATYVVPGCLSRLLNRFRLKRHLKHQPRDEVQLFIMIGTLVTCCAIGMAIGSPMLGAFVAGSLFVSVPRAEVVWGRQLKRVTAWLMRMFYAAAVSFTLPVEHMFTLNALWRAVALTVLAGVVPKLLSGAFAGRRNWMVVGCSMVPRGDLAYYIAALGSIKTVDSVAGRPTLMSPEAYVAVFWALVLNTLGAQRVLAWALRQRLDDDPRPRSASIGRQKQFCIRVEGLHRRDLLPEVIEVLNQLQLEVKEAVIETDDKVDVQVFTVQLRSDLQSHHHGEIDDDKLRKIKLEILDAIQDANAQVVCFAAEAVNYNMLEIQVTCTHHSGMLTEITEVLQSLDLEVYMASCQGTRDDTDVETFYAQNMGRPDTRIGGDKAFLVRHRLHQLMDRNGMKGEVMVKAPKYSQVPSHFTQQPRSVVEGFDDVMKVSVEADSHHPLVLHEVTAQLNALGLDVITADIETGDHDLAIFYVRARPGAARADASDVGVVRESLEDAIAGQQVDDLHIRVERPGRSALGAEYAAARATALAEAKYEGSMSSPATPGSGASAGRSGGSVGSGTPTRTASDPAMTPTGLATLRSGTVRVTTVERREAGRVLRARLTASPSDISSTAGSRSGHHDRRPSGSTLRTGYEDDSDSDVEGSPRRMGTSPTRSPLRMGSGVGFGSGSGSGAGAGAGTGAGSGGGSGIALTRGSFMLPPPAMDGLSGADITLSVNSPGFGAASSFRSPSAGARGTTVPAKSSPLRPFRRRASAPITGIRPGPDVAPAVTELELVPLDTILKIMTRLHDRVRDLVRDLAELNRSAAERDLALTRDQLVVMYNTRAEQIRAEVVATFPDVSEEALGASLEAYSSDADVQRMSVALAQLPDALFQEERSLEPIPEGLTVEQFLEKLDIFVGAIEGNLRTAITMGQQSGLTGTALSDSVANIVMSNAQAAQDAAFLDMEMSEVLFHACLQHFREDSRVQKKLDDMNASNSRLLEEVGAVPSLESDAGTGAAAEAVVDVPAAAYEDSDDSEDEVHLDIGAPGAGAGST